ncbi:MAG: hypothetical protein IT376_18545 [Polyangiaceae bacterium]|nr:hypothetical protein [Polyangiaceae bacterium]
MRTLADRPPLGLLARDGEPGGAIALAVAHDHGLIGSLALAELLRARLRAATTSTVAVRPHALGLDARVLVRTPDEAERAVRALAAALITPAPPRDPANAAAARALAAPTPAAGDPADECSARAGAGRRAPLAPARAAALVEAVRAGAATRATASLAAVGPGALLAAASRARDALAAWPDGAPPLDPWPASDVVLGAPAAGDAAPLTIAIRVRDGARARAAARSLREPGAPLSVRLGALEPAWQVRDAASVVRVRGACLRVDLEPAPDGGAPVTPTDAARAALIATDELEHGLDSEVDEPDDTAAAARDPREAAARAAWQMLVGTRPPGPALRRAIVHRSRAGAAEAARFPAAFDALSRAWGDDALDTRTRAERGHAEVAILLASPCGTARESAADAGASALALRAVASALNGAGSVEAGVLLHPDAVGLQVRAPRRTPREPPAVHALRVADVLGRALLRPIGAPLVDLERSRLLAEHAGVDARAWSATLEALAPGRPSWLEPRGTPATLAALRPAVVDAQRLAFAREPLRVAVMAPTGEAARAAADRLEQWLRSLRDAPEPCPAATAVDPRPGSVRFERPGALPIAYVGVPLAAAGPSARARLEAALAREGLQETARVLGGTRGGAVVLALRAADAGALASAVAAARARLASMPDRWGAESAWAEREGGWAAFGAETRLRRLWAGPAPAPIAPERLARIAGGFALDRHVVVVVEAPDSGQVAGLAAAR